MSVAALAGCGGWFGPSPVCRAHSHYANGVTVCGCGLCQEAVWSEHHPQWRVHGECPASLLQRHQDWQDPGAQVQLTPLFHISRLLLLNKSINLCLNGYAQLDLRVPHHWPHLQAKAKTHNVHRCSYSIIPASYLHWFACGSSVLRKQCSMQASADS